MTDGVLATPVTAVEKIAELTERGIEPKTLEIEGIPLQHEAALCR